MQSALILSKSAAGHGTAAGSQASCEFHTNVATAAVHRVTEAAGTAAIPQQS
jgi:hypothetical protein